MQQLQIDLTDPVAEFSPVRLNDKVIMKIFIDAGFKGHQLYILSICRIRCKALILTDITTGDGQRIRLNSWEAREDIVQTNLRDQVTIRTTSRLEQIVAA